MKLALICSWLSASLVLLCVTQVNITLASVAWWEMGKSPRLAFFFFFLSVVGHAQTHSPHSAQLAERCDLDLLHILTAKLSATALF